MDKQDVSRQRASRRPQAEALENQQALAVQAIEFVIEPANSKVSLSATLTTALGDVAIRDMTATLATGTRLDQSASGSTWTFAFGQQLRFTAGKIDYLSSPPGSIGSGSRPSPTGQPSTPPAPVRSRTWAAGITG